MAFIIPFTSSHTNLLLGIYLYKFFPETKGRSLEEVEAQFEEILHPSRHRHHSDDGAASQGLELEDEWMFVDNEELGSSGNVLKRGEEEIKVND